MESTSDPVGTVSNARVDTVTWKRAAELLGTLHLKEGVARGLLLQNLYFIIKNIPAVRQPRSALKSRIAKFNRTADAISELEAALRDCPFANYDHVSTLITLLPLKAGCDAQVRKWKKGGNKVDIEGLDIAVKLASFYFAATGKAPAPKSGSGYGTFYRFVKAVLAEQSFNADTVTRKGVKLWRDAMNHLPPPKKKPKRAHT